MLYDTQGRGILKFYSNCLREFLYQVMLVCSVATENEDEAGKLRCEFKQNLWYSSHLTNYFPNDW